MPQAKSPEEKRAEATQAFVDVAFDEAYIIREELYGTDPDPDSEEPGRIGLYARRKANREQLRSLSRQGFLSAEQVEELNELYPARKEKAEEAEEQGADAAKPAPEAA